MPLAIEEVHSVLAPVRATLDQFEFLAEQWMEWVRYPEMFVRTVNMRCS